MGPKLIQTRKGETEYTLRALPIGGYVKMEGEDEASEDPRGFSKVPVFSRIAVVVAGAMMNFLLAIVILSIVAFGIGVPSTTIKNPIEGKPAAMGGILPGDKIIEINGVKINKWESLVNEINSSDPNSGLDIKIQRGQEEKLITINPVVEDGRSIIGVEPLYEKSFAKAISQGFKDTAMFIKLMFEFFGLLFKGQVGLEQLSGPVGVIHEVGQAAKTGIYSLLLLMGFISINLGFINLLPIPALDGSRIVFLLIELVRGKPIDAEKEGFIHLVGFILLISLMLIVTYRDIIKFNIFRG